MAAPTGKGVTPMRSVRIPADPWEPAKAVAESNGETMTEMIVRLLAQAVEDDKNAIRCVCGRKFTNKAARTNHGRKCPQEQARSAEFIRRVEEGAKR